MECDRFWLLTWTTYGTWLPGDRRGFVSDVVEDGKTVRHNIPKTEYAADLPALEQHAKAQMKSEAVRLSKIQAELLLDQFLETAAYRKWKLFAAAIMANHCHLVVGVPGDPSPETLLRDFKSYGSGRLNKDGHRVPFDKRWTKSGSRRKLPDDTAVLGTKLLPPACGLLRWQPR